MIESHDRDVREGEQILHANGVHLCVETFGKSSDPAILLVAGMTSSMDWWESEFCQQLADGGRFVIRYDHRDTGRSVSYEPGSPPYKFDDLIADAVGLLDRLIVQTAHVMGISLGGGIGQRLALDHGHRVASLTLLSTSPGIRPNSRPRPDLPMPSAALIERFTRPAPAPDWTDRAAVIDHIVASQQALAGPRGVDDAHLRRLAAHILDRTDNIAASMTNHALIDPGSPYESRLDQITAPTLVIHGTEDPLFPYQHAEALAAEIPHARLLPLDGVGHQMPPRHTWNLVITNLLRHSGLPAGGFPAGGDVGGSPHRV